VSLLATDETYLKAEGLSLADIKGVITVCGVYCIPCGKLDLTLGGRTDLALRLDQMIPLRCVSRAHKGILPGIPMRLNFFAPAFGNDPRVRAAASPINHIQPGLPPFLIMSAENDLPTLVGAAEDFHRALVDNGCDAQCLQMECRNHNSIFFRATKVGDPTARAMLDFIYRHASEPVPSK